MRILECGVPDELEPPDVGCCDIHEEEALVINLSGTLAATFRRRMTKMSSEIHCRVIRV
jgi:hypothetical protein